MIINTAITFAKVYNEIAKALEEVYATISICSERVAEPATLPAVWVVEIDTHPELRYTALDFTDDQRRSTIEVQTFSNSLNGASLEANEIMNIVAKTLRSMGYIMNSNMPIDNADSNIKRRVAIFTRMIGGGDELGFLLGATESQIRDI